MEEFQAIPGPRSEVDDARQSASHEAGRVALGGSVGLLDARALKRLDDHREPKAKMRWDYDVLFGADD